MCFNSSIYQNKRVLPVAALHGVAKHLAQTLLCWPCTPCPLCMGWGCGPLLRDGAGSWGHLCLQESHMVSAGVWHRKCVSVWQPPQANGRWDPKVSPTLGTPSTSTITPLGVLWSCVPAPIVAGPSVGSLELPHSQGVPTCSWGGG